MLSSDLKNKLDSLAWCYCVVTRETGVEFPGRDLALENKLIPDSELGVLIWLHHVGTIRQRKKIRLLVVEKTHYKTNRCVAR